MEGTDAAGPVRDVGVSRDFSGDDIDHSAMDKRQAMYIGLRLPKRPHRPNRLPRKSRAKKHPDKVLPVNGTMTSPVALSPSEQIQNLLGEVDDEEHNSHDIFCQMDMLYKQGGEPEWREVARWVKYEEDVEEGGERWSKPHVASLSLHSLFELRSSLLTGAMMLDMDAYNMQQVIDLLLDNLVNAKLLEEGLREIVRNVVLRPHRHQHRKRKRSMVPEDDQPKFKRSMKRTFSEIGRQFSGTFLKGSNPHLLNVRAPTLRGNNSSPNMENLLVPEMGGLSESSSSMKLNQQFMRKIPEGAEVANIMVGEVEALKYQVSALIRLSDAKPMGDMAEVPLSTRFMFVILGPVGSQGKMYEIGRSMSTIMVDEVFREVAYKARNRQDILAGIDEFLDQVTVLPPGEWDPNIRIEPPQSVPSQEGRKQAPKQTQAAAQAVEEEDESSHCDPTLRRTGRLFGGLVEDIKRKVPWYGSDFKDVFHLQCIASIIFLYLATLTPNVTFGGLLGQATDQYMGTMECILTAAITGVLFALFSGQPLNILGSTGPMLVLEMILYHFCMEQGLDFLPFRCWIGLWTTFLLIIIVAFDLSALVRYITRFTEESFACLIALIFIYEAFKKLFGIAKEVPLHTHVPPDHIYQCACVPVNNSAPFNATDISFMNETFADNMTSAATFVNYNSTTRYENITSATMANFLSSDLSRDECRSMGGELVGPDCPYMADAFLLSVLLFIGTFTIALGLQSFKTSRFFPTWVRQNFSDFSVLLAILAMVGCDMALGIPTPKLNVPTEFKPTRSDRGWFVNPISEKNPWWLTLAGAVPALLTVILIFMDQQITAVIVNRKENKLLKGSGYHLDLFVVAICIAVCSLLGLPWYVAATVSAIAHIMSLKKESECTAPGERPTFLGVREQRVTALMVGLLSGLSVLFTSILRVIPMAVLYGVFLYMGVAALKGMQFVDRCLIIFMPAKYQPDHMYLRHVPIKKVHLFTLLQVLCLALLWVIKMIKSVSIIFPIMVLGTCFIRKGLDYIFSQRELKWLDDIMPEVNPKDAEDKEKLEEIEEGDRLLSEDNEKLMEVRIHHEKPCEKFAPHVIKSGSGDLHRVNISEEVSKTSIWLQVLREGEKMANDESTRSPRRRRGDKNGIRADKTDSVEKPAFYIQEEDDADLKKSQDSERESKI